jgi:hypothetical protein
MLNALVLASAATNSETLLVSQSADTIKKMMHSGLPGLEDLFTISVPLTEEQNYRSSLSQAGNLDDDAGSG